MDQPVVVRPAAQTPGVQDLAPFLTPLQHLHDAAAFQLAQDVVGDFRRAAQVQAPGDLRAVAL